MHEYFPIIYKVTTCKGFKIKKIIYIPQYQNFNVFKFHDSDGTGDLHSSGKHKIQKKSCVFVRPPENKNPGYDNRTPGKHTTNYMKMEQPIISEYLL